MDILIKIYQTIFILVSRYEECTNILLLDFIFVLSSDFRRIDKSVLVLIKSDEIHFVFLFFGCSYTCHE